MGDVELNTDDICLTTPRRTGRKRKTRGAGQCSNAPVKAKHVRLREAATLALYKVPCRQAAEEHNLDKMAVCRATKQIYEGDLPAAPPYPVQDTATFLVSPGSFADDGVTLNAHGLHLSAYDGKKPNNTRENIKRAWAETQHLNAENDYFITKAMLSGCVKFHTGARAKHRANRKGSRVPYSILSDIKLYKKPGRPTFFPEVVETALAEWVKALRRGKFKVTRRLVFSKLEAIVTSADAPELQHLESGITNHWYYRWLERHGFDRITQREMDTTRAMWCTSANMKVHYDVLEEVFTSIEVARAFADGVARDDLDWHKPGLVASIDETRISTNGQNETHSNTIGIASGENRDNGEVLTYKGSKSGSLTAGMYADMTPVPTMFVYNAAATFDPDWSKGGVPGCVHASNDKGPATERLFEVRVRCDCFLPMNFTPRRFF